MPCGSDAEGLGLHGGQLLGAGEGYWDELAPEITSLLASSLPMLFPQFLDPFLLEVSSYQIVGSQMFVLHLHL